jgi:hypothetical protein
MAVQRWFVRPDAGLQRAGNAHDGADNGAGSAGEDAREGEEEEIATASSPTAAASTTAGDDDRTAA